MSTAEADAHYAAWMRENLAHAAHHFGLTVTGQPVYGWRLRSIGAQATGTGGQRWLRVVAEQPEWAHGEHWTGNADANAITGINKPQVLDAHEWSDGRRQRAEVMTYLVGRPCSRHDVLRADLTLSGQWWTDLRHALGALSTIKTRRVHAGQDRISQRIRERFGTDVDCTIERWETAHGDLHWANLLCPQFGLLDWEHWGRGPAGLDAATLYFFSLLSPQIAHRVHTTFADTLDSRSGHVAQLYVAARILRRIDGGDFPDLAPQVTSLASRLRLRH